MLEPLDEYAHAWSVRLPGAAGAATRSTRALAAFGGELVGASVELTFTQLGAHIVTLLRTPSPLGGAATVVVEASRPNAHDDVDDTVSPFGGGDDDVIDYLEDEYEVMVKYVRREVRTLLDHDRERFFDALRVVYTTSQGAGASQYGAKFRSIEYLVAEHLQGAASRECDHWHDDAGILTHHMAFTLELEQSLQAIDASVAVPYWDYTHDAYYLGDNFRASRIFDDDWFGAASPGEQDHAISAGRWGYTRIARVAANDGGDEVAARLTYDSSASSEFGSARVISNPYGLLRSPWNCQSTPFLTRYHAVLGVENGGFSVPACDAFKEAFEHNELGYMLSELNGLLHGPVHIMIGGQWYFNEKHANLTTLITASRLNQAAGFFLLSSKFLWRQGYVRCPEYCSLDTPASDCSCTCPSAITGDRDPLELLSETGLLYLNNGWLRGDFLEKAGMDFADVWDMFCHIGHVGEMFTSAAPYDPTFWPLHGLAERFLTLKRIYAAEGLSHFNESWGYTHASTLASDTHVVCDWTNVTGMELPTCAPGICPGHKAHDLLPMGGFINGTETYTNKEFYDFTSPFNAELPYVYDSFTKWDACLAQNISFKRSHGLGASGTKRASDSRPSHESNDDLYVVCARYGQGKCQTASSCAWDHSNATCAYTGVNATDDAAASAADDGDDVAAAEAFLAARPPAAGGAGRARRWVSSALAYSGMGRR